MQNSNKQGFWHGFNIAAIIIVTLFALGIPLLHTIASFLQSVDITAQQTEGAVLYTPTTFAIAITNELSSPLNAVEFELNYNPNELLITKIEPHTTLCEERFLIQNVIDTASGTASFQCGTITPFALKEGTIATVHAIPLSSGTSSVTFGTRTNVLAHDGYGTNLTRARNNLTFTTY